MSRLVIAGFVATLVFSSAGAQQPPLTLEKIMADPDWIGTPVGTAYWSVDGKGAYYMRKRTGSPIVDLHRVDIASGKDDVVDGASMAASDGPNAVYDIAGTRAAFVRNGDVFVRELASGRLTQVTRSAERSASPQPHRVWP